MGTTARFVRRSGRKGIETTTSRSFRVPNELLEQVQRKVARDPSLTINRVIVELLTGWVRGIYRLPKRRVEVVEERTYETSAPAPETVGVQ